MIAKKDMVVNGIYRCKARNFLYGIWNGEYFEYIRTKFNHTYYFQADREFHWDDGAPHGTVQPMELMAWDK